MKLYWFWSINPQKVRLALNELALPHDVVEVDITRGEQRQPEFVRLNPNAKVPVLQDGEFVLWESNAILAYLGEVTGRYWPAGAPARADALRWLFFEARQLSEPIGTVWFNGFVAPLIGRPADETSIKQAQEQLDRFLPIVEQRLGDRTWLQGDQFTLVDCCYGPLFDALALSRTSLAPYPHIKRYVELVRARPAWKQCAFRA